MGQFIGGPKDGDKVPSGLEFKPYIEVAVYPSSTVEVMETISPKLSVIRTLLYKRGADGNFRLPGELPFRGPIPELRWEPPV